MSRSARVGVVGVVGVVTVAHGRHDHLAQQELSLAAGTRQPDVRVVVALDDPGLDGPDVLHLDADPWELPLAAARNAGAAAAAERGADVLVLLDVDCLAGPDLVAAYADAAHGDDGTVWSGPVSYLRAQDRPYDLARLVDLDDPHPARPAPGPGARVDESRWALFWSLSFAVSAAGWERAGGFDEAYTGYGAEDTDFGQRARAAGMGLTWLGDARAYHQHHLTHSPPVQHLADIVRNGRTFHRRWGWWPMAGWLEAFEERGLVAREGEDWVLPGTP